MSIIQKNLFDSVLLEPVVKQGADELFIVSGYATATMAMRHIEAVRRICGKNIAIRLIVGMCPQDGIQKSQHLGFQKLESGEYGNDFQCSYIINRPPVHAKVYSWLRKGDPILGYLGSANYTQNAFSTSMREVLINNNALDCYKYYHDLIDETIRCTSDNVESNVLLFDRQPERGGNPSINKEIDVINSETQTSITQLALSDNPSLDKITLSLLDKRTNEVPMRSGLNWGQRPEYNRDPNQAYINIPASIGRTEFFPERFVQFMVLTDDGKELICVRAQDNGKGLHTTLNNSLMGEYFRFRLGLANGAKVTKDDLLRYGRTDVDFYKIDEETYFMDFAVK